MRAQRASQTRRWLDECCLLPSQLLIPSLDWLPASDGLVSRLQPKQPLRLQFGRVPTLPGSAATLQLDGLARAPGQPKIDHLRRLHLGACPTEECKACTRCGCVTMLKSPNRTTAVKQWEQRWIKNCLVWRALVAGAPQLPLSPAAARATALPGRSLAQLTSAHLAGLSPGRTPA
ncbi:hypothetical protein H8959_017437 [Pygathrix nigripes]